jgi:hypothetical protein
MKERVPGWKILLLAFFAVVLLGERRRAVLDAS